MGEKEKQSEGEFKLAEVTIDTKVVITDGKNTYTPEEALVLVLNKLDNLQKKLVG